MNLKSIKSINLKLIGGKMKTLNAIESLLSSLTYSGEIEREMSLAKTTKDYRFWHRQNLENQKVIRKLITAINK